MQSVDVPVRPRLFGASVDGLVGLSIGRLATELAVSKSGVFAHFGSREELQLSTLTFARNVFIDHVITPALRSPAGLSRLGTLCDARLSYMSQLAFELDALARTAGANALLFDDPTAFGLARTAILARFRATATDPSALPD